jgi:hypothetical protein
LFEHITIRKDYCGEDDDRPEPDISTIRKWVHRHVGILFPRIPNEIEVPRLQASNQEVIRPFYQQLLGLF